MLLFSPEPLRPSLANLVRAISITLATLARRLARTLDQHRLLSARAPDLKAFKTPASRVAGLQTRAAMSGRQRTTQLLTNTTHLHTCCLSAIHSCLHLLLYTHTALHCTAQHFFTSSRKAQLKCQLLLSILSLHVKHHNLT